MLAADYPFLDVLWTMFIFFLFVIWIWILISVFADVFRRKMSTKTVTRIQIQMMNRKKMNIVQRMSRNG